MPHTVINAVLWTITPFSFISMSLVANSSNIPHTHCLWHPNRKHTHTHIELSSTISFWRNYQRIVLEIVDRVKSFQFTALFDTHDVIVIYLWSFEGKNRNSVKNWTEWLKSKRMNTKGGGQWIDFNKTFQFYAFIPLISAIHWRFICKYNERIRCNLIKTNGHKSPYKSAFFALSIPPSLSIVHSRCVSYICIIKFNTFLILSHFGLQSSTRVFF